VVTPANNKKIAIALAFAGSLPSPLPLTWLHKFYLGEYLWGIAYLVLAPTMLPSMACCLEGIWYLTQSDEGFLERFPKAGLLLLSTNLSSTNLSSANLSFGDKSADKTTQSELVKNAKAQTAQQVAAALRDLDQLRQEGLITEYEFEQKRRNLLSEIS